MRDNLWLKSWARRYLVPSGIYRACQSHMRLVIPHIRRAHWSLFILEQDRVYHFDNTGDHTSPNDVDFVKTEEGVAPPS